ncbi:hypothetical protein RHMOL_Rhmol02G0045900 [Rhododendron molle]|uniref:Uncharacterized protein n=1 Tax=Rhododendron molle TaxID=49168 RepID=A0ACC0PM09_RHOML|nr:hypothetical protein RHMOL_Rhmol02G0045900 [Rhododendron molle]
MDSSEDDEIRFFNCVADFAVKKRDKDGSLEELQACFSISEDGIVMDLGVRERPRDTVTDSGPNLVFISI